MRAPIGMEKVNNGVLAAVSRVRNIVELGGFNLGLFHPPIYDVDKYCEYGQKEKGALVWTDVFIQDV